MTNRTFYSLVAGLGGAIILSTVIALIIIFHSSSAAGRKQISPGLSDDVTSSPKEHAVVYSFFSQLDGRAVSTSAEVNPRIVTVMIDNHSDARPQAGIAEAHVVYEVPVEGSLTRYLAIFDENDSVPRIGPVRSARPYFIDVAREYGNPLYLHSGGSPEALSLLKSGIIRDINEFAWGSSFWRVSNKNAPHNLFTSSSAWISIEKGLSQLSATFYSPNDWQSWRFMRYGNDEDYAQLALATTSVSSSQSNSSVAIRFAANYTIGWKYDARKQEYFRLIQGVPSVDAFSQPILATTILVQQAAVKSLDSEDRKSIALIGSGKGMAISRGQVVRATWKKASPTDRTRWYDSDGKELVFIPGTVWVEVVPLTTAITLE